MLKGNVISIFLASKFGGCGGACGAANMKGQHCATMYFNY